MCENEINFLNKGKIKNYNQKIISLNSGQKDLKSRKLVFFDVSIENKQNHNPLHLYGLVKRWKITEENLETVIIDNTTYYIVGQSQTIDFYGSKIVDIKLTRKISKKSTKFFDIENILYFRFAGQYQSNIEKMINDHENLLYRIMFITYKQKSYLDLHIDFKIDQFYNYHFVDDQTKPNMEITQKISISFD